MIFQLNKQISTMLIRRKHLSFHGQAGTCILTGDEDGDEFTEGCPWNKFVIARGSAFSFFFLCHSPNYLICLYCLLLEKSDESKCLLRQFK